MTGLIADAEVCRLFVTTAGEVVTKCAGGPRRVLFYSTGGRPDADELQCWTELDTETVVDEFLSRADTAWEKRELVERVNDALAACEDPNADPI